MNRNPGSTLTNYVTIHEDVRMNGICSPLLPLCPSFQLEEFRLVSPNLQVKLALTMFASHPLPPPFFPLPRARQRLWFFTSVLDRVAVKG